MIELVANRLRRVRPRRMMAGYPMVRARRIGPPIPVRFYSPMLDRFVLHGLEHGELAGLGFSLKPPKWLRKAQPGKFLKKHALPIVIGAAALAIPGVAPAAMGVLKGAGGLALKGAGAVLKGGKAVGGIAGRFLSRAKLPTQALREAAATAVMPTIIPSQAIAPEISVPEPAAYVATGATQGGAGGAEFVGPSGAPEAIEEVRTAGVGPGPGLAILGGLALLMMVTARRR